ncbi:hypothetical protein KCU78_g23925, partial [Aureobasidium melanogenum]
VRCGQAIKIDDEADTNKSRVPRLSATKIKVRRRPSCRMCLERGSKCEYSVEEGKTQQQATKEQLRSYKDVLSLLRNSSPKESEAILHILKNMDLNDACRFILDGPVFVPNS